MYEKVMAAHQPNFMPYLGFFDKLEKSDVFIIRDEVLFVEKDYHHRNRIRINGVDNINNPQFKWLKVPVMIINDYIKHLQIKADFKQKNKLWSEQILHDIKVNYDKAPHFNDFFPEFESIILNSDGRLLSLNMEIINFLKKSFGLKTKIVMASDFALKPDHYEKFDASEDLVALCKAVGANVYLSGAGGKGYLSLEPFDREDIEVRFQEYHHPVYKQRYPGFVPNMAAVDALFCTGALPVAETLKQELSC
jgi:hypothetical protein